MRLMCIHLFVVCIAVPVDAQETFTEGGSFATCRQPSAMVVTDVNNDGTPDAIVSGRSSNYQNGVLAFLYGAGDGTLRERIEMPTGSFPASLQVTDVHKDGLGDVLVAHDNDQTILCYANEGLGGFKLKETTKLKIKPSLFMTGDFNKDGNPDAALVPQDGTELQVWKGTGKGSFKFGAAFALPARPVDMIVADFAGNGQSQTLMKMDNSTIVHLVAPTEKSGKWEFATATFDMRTDPYFAKVADMDGDGIDDATVLKRSAAEIQIIYGESAGLFLDKSVSIPVSTTSLDFALADFNRDGKPDIAVLDPTNEVVRIYLNQHAGSSKARIDPNRYAVIYSTDYSKANTADVGMLSSFPSVSMLLYDGAGNLVREYFKFDSDLADGQFGLEWDGLDGKEQSVAEGQYVFYYKLGVLVLTRIIKK